jgi:2-oxoglutarate ferredoxin oxidoreductase subunit alpha
MTAPPKVPDRTTHEEIVIRFAGDSGDGMQLTGTQFMLETALVGNDLITFPDYPAEIRAPAGTTFGVSAFQIHFGAHDVRTVGDEVNVLVAMNPAALKVNLKDLGTGGLVVVDTAAFTDRNLAKAGYEANPLENEALAPFQVLKLDIARLTLEAVKDFGLSQKEALRSRNMWTLGLMLWIFGRDRQATVAWLEEKFSKRPEIARANIAALNAGHAFGETAEMPSFVHGRIVNRADLEPGLYRTVTGNEAIAWGLVVGAQSAGLRIMPEGSGSRRAPAPASRSRARHWAWPSASSCRSSW